jgi:hypothetical protein
MSDDGGKKVGICRQAVWKPWESQTKPNWASVKEATRRCGKFTCKSDESGRRNPFSSNSTDVLVLYFSSVRESILI